MMLPLFQVMTYFESYQSEPLLEIWKGHGLKYYLEITFFLFSSLKAQNFGQANNVSLALSHL